MACCAPLPVAGQRVVRALTVCVAQQMSLVPRRNVAKAVVMMGIQDAHQVVTRAFLLVASRLGARSMLVAMP